MQKQWKAPAGARRAVVVAAVASWCDVAAATAAPPDAVRPSVMRYDSNCLPDYPQKWPNIYGPLDGATRSVDNGFFTASDVPFKTGVDFSVYDHLKYMAVSNRTFDAPQSGSIACWKASRRRSC